MKNKPDSKKAPFGAPPEPSALLNDSERNRIIFMVVLLLVVAVAFGTSMMKKVEYEDASDAQLDDRLPIVEEEPDEIIAVRRFDPATIAGKVRDETPEQRVIIDLEPLAKMLDHVAGYGPGQWKGLKPNELNAKTAGLVLADPESHRAFPFWMRGKLTSYEERPVGDRVAWYGTLETEDGTHVTFMTSSFDSGLFGAVEEDLTYARLEGLFLEVHRREGPDGWVETPLIVGSRLAKSYPKLDGFNDTDLGNLLAAVRDDTAISGPGMDEATVLAQWLLMDRLAQGWGEEFNWNDIKQAPVLDNKMFEWLTDEENGDLARGMPFVLPISRNMGSRTLNPGENPARLDTITTGWVGNFNWTKKGAVLKYIAPGGLPEIAAGDTRQLIQGRGFFLKNLRYQSSKVETRLAPVLVMHSLEVYTPIENNNVSTIIWFVGGLTILLVCLIPLLVIRDRKQAEKLRKELVRRKQERRRRTAPIGQA